MKNITEIKPDLTGKVTIPSIKGKRSSKRFSPFLWIGIFLFFFIMYKAVTQTGTLIQFILCPFLIANMIYADFAILNYYRTKKKTVILIIESLISAAIIYWAI